MSKTFIITRKEDGRLDLRPSEITAAELQALVRDLADLADALDYIERRSTAEPRVLEALKEAQR